MSSYHDNIQAVAKAIEAERAKSYSQQGSGVRLPTIAWTERQLCYLYAAIYKLLRVKNETRSMEKAKDDILDAYNYLALLFEDLPTEIPK